MERRLVREVEARHFLGDISHGAFYELRRRGAIPVLHLGRASYYDVEDLRAFVERLRAEHGLGEPEPEFQS